MKNYQFTYNFPTWGNCDVTMTSVLGHLTSLDFDQRYRKWASCRPGQLFEASTVVNIDNVRLDSLRLVSNAHVSRIKSQSQITSLNKPSILRFSSSGPIAIEKVSTLELK